LKRGFKKLGRNFYLRDTIKIARQLIGKVIFRKTGSSYLSGIIVETEAYLGEKDAASHAYGGKKNRNEVMFEEGGKAYVYFTYGNHFCFNVVTGKSDSGSAVLIRALEPVLGVRQMMKNRSIDDLYNLTNGPGKLTKAFRIDKTLNGVSLLGDKIFICEPEQHKKFTVRKSKRIGISKNTDKLYRFYMKGNPYVSRNFVVKRK
jgi:DNA-3-methyladenine glycosylase